MRRGRPPVGVALIDRVEAPRVARKRVRVILATLAGTLSVTDACAQLDVRRARFHALRQQVLRGALEAVAARPRGRPRRPSTPTRDVRTLERRIRELELALRATQLRSEIALTMPFLLDRVGRKKKPARRPAPPARARGARRARAAEARR